MSGVDFDEYEAVRFGSLAEGFFEFSFRADIKPQPSSEYLHEFIIMPGLDIVVRAIADCALVGFSFPISSSSGLVPRFVIAEIPHHFSQFPVGDSITPAFKFPDLVFKKPVQRFCYINIIVFHNNLLF